MLKGLRLSFKTALEASITMTPCNSAKGFGSFSPLKNCQGK